MRIDVHLTKPLRVCTHMSEKIKCIKCASAHCALSFTYFHIHFKFNFTQLVPFSYKNMQINLNRIKMLFSKIYKKKKYTVVFKHTHIDEIITIIVWW